MAEAVNKIEAAQAGFRFERIIRDGKEYVKVFGKSNNVVNINGRWYSSSNPAVAKYLSSSSAALSKLKAGGVTAALVISVDVLNALAEGRDITNADFAIDTGVDITVSVGSGAAGAAIGAAVGSAVPIAGTAIGAVTGFVAGMAIDYASQYLISKFNIRDWLKDDIFKINLD